MQGQSSQLPHVQLLRSRRALRMPQADYRAHLEAVETLRALDRKLTVENAALEVPPVALSESGYLQVEHKNKFGKDYPPVAEEQPAYTGVRK